MQKVIVATAVLTGASAAESSCYLHGSDVKKPFSDSEVDTMRTYYLANINIEGKGGVVAAPDYDTPGGSYYFHWMRDAALSMRTLQETSSNFTDYDSLMQSYTQWVLTVQSEESPNGIDVRTEPKFNLPDGDVFTGGWCRPQNDGPGLRATTLMMYAETLIDYGRIEYVGTYLWTSDPEDKNGGAIKYDLDYIVDGWDSSTCDLWEEYTDADLFWNRYTMKKAMYLGADFAEHFSDSESAALYRETADKIDETLYSNHWTGEYVQEATGRTKDGAVIVGFNEGFIGEENGDPFYPTAFEVASTVNAYNTMFCNEYSINEQDTNSGVPGILYGRYENDSYAGGNPWQLLTAALANLFYRGANYILDEGLPSSEALDMWATAFNLPDGYFDGKSASAVSEQFVVAGDSVLTRLRGHVDDNNFHLTEQMDENTGAQMSAEDLTWSYAEVLNAMHSRDVWKGKK